MYAILSETLGRQNHMIGGGGGGGPKSDDNLFL